MTNKKAKGRRAKTRDKFKRSSRVTVNKQLHEFEIGSRVNVVGNSAIHGGLPFRRYIGACGVVTGKQGSAYIVQTKEGNADRKLILSAVQLTQCLPPAKNTTPANKAAEALA